MHFAENYFLNCEFTRQPGKRVVRLMSSSSPTSAIKVFRRFLSPMLFFLYFFSSPILYRATILLVWVNASEFSYRYTNTDDAIFYSESLFSRSLSGWIRTMFMYCKRSMLHFGSFMHNTRTHTLAYVQSYTVAHSHNSVSWCVGKLFRRYRTHTPAPNTIETEMITGKYTQVRTIDSIRFFLLST